MTKVNICGLSDTETEIAAAEAGADFLGFVFATSRRQVTPEKVNAIAAVLRRARPSDCPALVGVFANSPAEEVNRIADNCNLDFVQLSGDESWQYCQEIDRPIIRVIHISAGLSIEKVTARIELEKQHLPDKQLIFLLDTFDNSAHGGTGQAFDWRIARELSDRFPVMVAGGLTPNNVGKLVREVKPWGVDISSGVETQGQKEISKIIAFIKEAKGHSP